MIPPDAQPLPPSDGRFAVGTITDGPDGEYLTDRLTDEALAFIEEKRDGPFFLNVWNFGVHGPWGHKPELTKTFVDKKDPSGRQGNPIMASMLKSVDESLGRIMGKLEELGIEDETILVFYSDNGGNVHSNLPLTGRAAKRKPPESPTMVDYRKWAGFLPPTSNLPLRGGKGDLYEGGQRVPLMVRWPGKIQPGSTTQAIVGPIDFYPTLLAVAGIEEPKGQILDGLSFLPVLTGTGVLERTAFYSWFPHRNAGASVRVGDWKLIRRLRPYGDYPGLRELYHLKADIGETHNLAREKPERVRALELLLEDHLRTTGALYPLLNPTFLAGGMTPSASGLVPDQCKLTPLDSGIRLEAAGGDARLGTALVRHKGPMTLSIRLRSPRGGTARLEWTTADQVFFPRTGQDVEFQVAGGTEWQDIQVPMPCESLSDTVRLSRALEGSPWDIQSMVFRAAGGAHVVHAWHLAAPKPARSARLLGVRELIQDTAR